MSSSNPSMADVEICSAASPSIVEGGRCFTCSKVQQRLNGFTGVMRAFKKASGVQSEQVLHFDCNSFCPLLRSFRSSHHHVPHLDVRSAVRVIYITDSMACVYAKYTLEIH